ncbi:MAG: hypothetical protein LASZOEIN_002325, partial [Candidatus Fervidibacter sp.]
RYVDGSPLWGEIVPFGGTRGAGRGTGWEWGWRLIVPEKPIREAIVYALFRYRRGKAWFDGVGLSELRLPERVKLESLEPKLQALVDGDFRTAWQGSGEQVIVLAAKSAAVGQIAIWWQRPELKADFVRVEVYDGGDWKIVAERQTDADTWLTVLDFAATKTHQLRLTLKGKNYTVREIEAR